MPQLFANNAYGALAGSINGAATLLTLASGNGARFPTPSGGDYFHATLVGLDANGNENAWEIVRCTARTIDQLTVVRAQEGTTATSWNAGTRIEVRLTAEGLDTKEATGTATTTMTAHTSAVDPHPQYTTAAEASAAAPIQSVAGKTGTVSLVKGDVGLGNVDNTADADKPVSTATQTALDGKQAAGSYASTTHNHPDLKVALPADDIDLATGSYFTKTIAAATTLTVSNVPTTGIVGSFVLELTNGGAYAITLWAGVKWAGGTVPVLTTAGKDLLGFITHDAGTTWTGLVLGKDVK